jgi:hypothetical protein
MRHVQLSIADAGYAAALREALSSTGAVERGNGGPFRSRDPMRAGSG